MIDGELEKCQKLWWNTSNIVTALVFLKDNVRLLECSVTLTRLLLSLNVFIKSSPNLKFLLNINFYGL